MDHRTLLVYSSVLCASCSSLACDRSRLACDCSSLFWESRGFDGLISPSGLVLGRTGVASCLVTKTRGHLWNMYARHCFCQRVCVYASGACVCVCVWCQCACVRVCLTSVSDIAATLPVNLDFIVWRKKTHQRPTRKLGRRTEEERRKRRGKKKG